DGSCRNGGCSSRFSTKKYTLHSFVAGQENLIKDFGSTGLGDTLDPKHGKTRAQMKPISCRTLLLVGITLAFSIFSFVSAQEPLRFSGILINSTNVTLTWNTTSAFFQIEQTASLSSPEWLRRVVTTN